MDKTLIQMSDILRNKQKWKHINVELTEILGFLDFKSEAYWCHVARLNRKERAGDDVPVT